MPLGIYSSTAFTLTGVDVKVAANASIEVRREDTGALASIFSDRAGGAGLANPFTADGEGRFNFYAAGLAEGYQVKVTKDAESLTLNNQPVGLLQELDASAAINQNIVVHIGGQAIDEEIILDGFFFEDTATIQEVTIFARDAPVGAAFTIDFLKGGVEQTKIATLADGVSKQATTISGLSYTDTEEFGLKVKSVGSTNPGAEIAIILSY
ncbi:MAG: hypothetical protein IIA70_05020 [Proteobacteria bacterium]|nr:hypothetical protein [Pseudomonadota bacterium]